MDNIFARLNIVDEHPSRIFAKFQEWMQKQLDNRHSDIELLSTRITAT